MTAIHYQLYEGPPGEEVLAWVVQVNEEIFGFGESAEAIAEKLAGQKQILICLAFRDDAVVGFKAGFKERYDYFKSWRGGVLPSARRQGIAAELMKRQHAWAAEQGFRIITTNTENNNVPMQMLNLHHGFKVVGTFLDRSKHLKVILQKWLVDPDGIHDA